MSALDKVRVGYAPLSGSIYIYRHGKDPRVALDKRDAEAEVVTAVVDWMMRDAPKGATLDVTVNGARYFLTVRPAEEEA